MGNMSTYTMEQITACMEWAARHTWHYAVKHNGWKNINNNQTLKTWKLFKLWEETTQKTDNHEQ